MHLFVHQTIINTCNRIIKAVTIDNAIDTGEARIVWGNKAFFALSLHVVTQLYCLWITVNCSVVSSMSVSWTLCLYRTLILIFCSINNYQ